jgi:hypothetical protein
MIYGVRLGLLWKWGGRSMPAFVMFEVVSRLTSDNREAVIVSRPSPRVPVQKVNCWGSGKPNAQGTLGRA